MNFGRFFEWLVMAVAFVIVVLAVMMGHQETKRQASLEHVGSHLAMFRHMHVTFSS